MGSINQRGGKLFFDFRYQGQRCREYTKLEDSLKNRNRMNKILDRIEAEILLETFDYRAYFPDSKLANQFDLRAEFAKKLNHLAVTFHSCAEQWFTEMEHSWRPSHRKNTRQTLDFHILPEFGDHPIDQITKSEILAFRGKLTKADPNKRRTKGLSPSRINHIMTPLRMILEDASDKHQFVNPWKKIDPLKVPKSDVDPFDLDEVQQIINNVRPDFTHYYTTRFFTGMRPSEIDGLMWKYVDFKRRQILVREAIVEGEMVYVKNDGSFREIDMSQVVFDKLKEQQKLTGKQDYVFCNSAGKPLDHGEVTKNVWHPLLRFLELKPRRPYQTRHTAATLWLAAGESPEWIARQMGHTTTEMLFTVYSRFVPNLTRKDGSAFEQVLKSHLGEKTDRHSPTLKTERTE